MNYHARQKPELIPKLKDLERFGWLVNSRHLPKAWRRVVTHRDQLNWNFPQSASRLDYSEEVSEEGKIRSTLKDGKGFLAEMEKRRSASERH